MDKIEKVRNIIKEECDEITWKYHIVPVVKYAKLLAKKLNADEEVVELAALLHDIGRAKYGKENHEITGAIEAEKILRELGYSEDVIKEVTHAIRAHRGSKNIPRETMVAEIVANADAMVHFDTIPLLFKAALKSSNNDVLRATRAVYEKLERDWNKKLTLPLAKDIVKEKHRAAKLLLQRMIE